MQLWTTDFKSKVTFAFFLFYGLFWELFQDWIIATYQWDLEISSTMLEIIIAKYLFLQIQPQTATTTAISSLSLTGWPLNITRQQKYFSKKSAAVPGLMVWSCLTKCLFDFVQSQPWSVYCGWWPGVKNQVKIIVMIDPG